MTQLFGEEVLVEHYQKLLTLHGNSPKTLQYRDLSSQMARFRVLCEISPEMDSVLDVGCGLAHLYHYLRAEGFEGRYTGIDIVPEFVDMANAALSKDTNANILLGRASQALPATADYALLSGVFNNRMNNNKEFMENTLIHMYSAARKGIAFNAMSSFVDYKEDNLYYVNPLEVFEFCKVTLGGYPVLRHDYMLSENGFPFEFAMYVYKEPQNMARYVHSASCKSGWQ